MKKKTNVEQLKEFYYEIKKELKKHGCTFGLIKHLLKTNNINGDYFYDFEDVIIHESHVFCNIRKIIPNKEENVSGVLFNIHVHTDYIEGLIRNSIYDVCSLSIYYTEGKGDDWEMKEKTTYFNANTWDIVLDDNSSESIEVK
ncbi:MAG: hypothetical protein NC222_06875 [Staphylococcus sp.]|nr:hypothetical protein [Staphylococcus sp.]